MIVADASVVLELILQTAAAAADELLDDERSLHAPRLIDLEVAQVLRRYVRAGMLGVRRSREALDDFAALRIERYRTSGCWTASGVSDNLSAYDAAYVALAEGLGAPLLTSDARIARAPGASGADPLARSGAINAGETFPTPSV